MPQRIHIQIHKSKQQSNIEVSKASITPPIILNHNLGLKNYELSNHLGNVTTVISDRIIPRSVLGTNINFYMPDIVSATDYYPFGMTMQERTFTAGGEAYRFGFNGKEKDNEISVDGGNLDFGARIYDSRLGRWMSVDPDFKLYPSFSLYNFGANNPIVNIDANGKRIYFVPGLGYNPSLNKPEKYVSGIEKSLEVMLSDFNTYSKTIVGSNPSGSKNRLVARIPDMEFVVNFGQKPAVSYTSDIRIENTIFCIVEDLLNNPKNPNEQINLLGTSQGSVTIAQAAIFLVENPEQFGLDKNFKIDNLVLAGTPIDKKSELYTKLQKLESEGKIGKILYDNYQSKDNEGNYNDQVTGLAGTNQTQASFNGFGFLLDAMLGRRGNHPHLKAASDKATNSDYNSFGEQIKETLCTDEVH